MNGQQHPSGNPTYYYGQPNPQQHPPYNHPQQQYMQMYPYGGMYGQQQMMNGAPFPPPQQMSPQHYHNPPTQAYAQYYPPQPMMYHNASPVATPPQAANNMTPTSKQRARDNLKQYDSKKHQPNNATNIATPKNKQNNKEGSAKKQRSQKRKGKKRKEDNDLFIPEKYKVALTIGNSPEEIKKWREDRRKNFPTRANIEKKKAAETEKSAAESTKVEEKECNDDTIDSEKKNPSGLSGLTMYDSDSNGEDGLDDKQKTKTPKRQRRKRKAPGQKPCAFFLRGKCRRGKDCKNLHDEQLKVEKLVKKRKQAVAESKQAMMGKQANGKSTLLRKLLKKDLTNEYTVFLQCVRYMVQNNFLQKEA